MGILNRSEGESGVFIARDGEGNVVGSGNCYQFGDHVTLGEIRVNEGERRKGWGGQIWEAIVTWASKRGAHEVVGQVTTNPLEEADAREFWEKRAEVDEVGRISKKL